MSEGNNFDVNKAVDDMKKDRHLGLSVIGFAAAIVGLFLPWYSFSIFGITNSVSPGLNSTGLLIAIAAVIGGGAALNVMNKDQKQMRTVAVVAAGVALLVIIANYPDDSLGSFVGVSLGYWLTLVGAGVALFASLMKKKSSEKPAAPVQ